METKRQSPEQEEGKTKSKRLKANTKAETHPEARESRAGQGLRDRS